MRDAILEIPLDWFEWDEKKITVQVYKGLFDENDYSLRLSFWEEYEACFESCQAMKTKNIVSGIMSEQTFYKNVLSSPGRLLFIITEPSFYKKRQKLIHHLALNKILDIVNAPIKEDAKTGLPDTKMMDLQFKAYQYIDQRLHGGIIQKHQVDQNTKNLHVHTTATQKGNQPIPNTVEDLDRRIAEVDAQLIGNTIAPSYEPIAPVDAVHKEAGRVVDAEFVNLSSNRDNSHRE